jgi:hypothetical protein
MLAIRSAKREELLAAREKLRRLENDLSFKLEEGGMPQHIEEAMEEFLKDLNEVINKSTKVY